MIHRINTFISKVLRKMENNPKLKAMLLKRVPQSFLPLFKKLYRHLISINKTARLKPSSFYPDFYANSPALLSKEPVFLNIKVATILDEFSYKAWASEFNLVPLKPDTWREVLNTDFDFLFVESAWAGSDGAWQYKLTGKNAPSSELRDLIHECEKLDIPTVFWNKEDPPHFSDFLESAMLFGYIFTSDANMLEAYKEASGHGNVHPLSFAAQPNLHNPARNGINYAEKDIAFAGTYFQDKYPERQQQMDLLFNAAEKVASKHNATFEIFSRHFGKNEKYQFPSAFEKRVVGSLPYSRMLAAYRSFKVFLNVNSVTDSPSMCSRRIFEILASGTAIVSTPSKAISNFFTPDQVPTVTNTEDGYREIRALINSPMQREKIVHRAQREIWKKHTYSHRALEILDVLEIPVTFNQQPLTSIICSTNRDPHLEHLFAQVQHQTHTNIELLILSHGIAFEEGIRERAERLGIHGVSFFHASADVSLGECLNKLIENASGQIIAKFDDDDYYHPEYLADQISALAYSGADMVGKASIYFYLESKDLLVRRWPHAEHRWTNFVAGATFVGKANTFRRIKFRELNGGEDSAFLRDLAESGLSVYSSDRFNYIAVRHDNAAHTWSITDEEILSYSTVETFSLDLKHVEA